MTQRRRRAGKRKYVLFLIAVLIIVIGTVNSTRILLKAVYPLKYQEYVYRYSAQNRLDPYLVFAVIKAESSFNPDAVSDRNARGLMQLSEKTAIWGASEIKLDGFTVGELYNPEINIRLGCWYLKWLMEAFDNDIDLVIAAYNGGSGNVSEWLKDLEFKNSGNKVDRIPFSETREFLKRVRAYRAMYVKLYESAF